MEIRAAATLATSHLFVPLNHAFPSSSVRVLSCSDLKHSVSVASTRPIPRPQSRKSTPAHGFSRAKMSVAAPESLIAAKKKAAEVLDDMRGTSIFLVGMNSTLKTDMGKILADSLRYYYFDSDSLVEQAAGGASAAKSYRVEDEKGFQESETEVLKQLSSMGRLVVCTGDGAVQSSINLSYIRYGISIWVDLPLDYLANELLMSEVSSPTTGITLESESFSKVLDELMQRYNELKEGFATADATVSLQKVASQLGYDDLTSVTPEDMALEVLNEIQRLTRVKKMMEEAGRPF
ncbi:hypothetical protein Cni_G11277 [Canna indica]|uniref:Inactive shikimate kinase like 1, chloroplastic n=1 Tax=Canna indica TaxID=4628 RepID=A0AAQ3K8E5_9LILI|nr:hypothetical protein Cni_G11277 [Canna indica]